MNHLTDEQFEEIMQGIEVDTEHLASCHLCQSRLEEKQALANRLRSAFDNVKPSVELDQTIRRQINVEATGSEQLPKNSFLNIRFHWRGWIAAISSAAAVLILVSLIMYTSAPSQAVAAQAELVKIHQHNISGNHEFYSEAEPEKLAVYFKDNLGFNPRLPEPDRGLALRGCCVRHFQGQIVGSYVVDTPEGVMSVIVVTDLPESLGIADKFKYGEYIFWKSAFAKCDMVSVRIGDYTYCAVGEISYEYLAVAWQTPARVR
ncbi:MAG: hypothetical protein ACYSSP_11845 [Planctomycetota bacterium]|jgi:hypothetical protein